MAFGSVPLAIVIPAFKPRFLGRTLASIAEQTDKRFRVYVCDDHGPDEIRTITKQFENQLNIVYKRFAENLGGQSLTRQWERSISLTSEEWIWLFSDDEIMESRCVEAVLGCAVAAPHTQVFQFDTVLIDSTDRVIALNPPHPPQESSLQFLYFFLRGLRASMMQDHVFSRGAYDASGGFEDFPLAWCADQAFVLTLARTSDMVTVPGPKVRFRQSGDNISSSKDRALSRKKAEAALQFVEWLHSYLDEAGLDELAIGRMDWHELTRVWLIHHLGALHHQFEPYQCLRIAKYFSVNWNEPLVLALARMAKLNVRTAAVHLSQHARRLLVPQDPSTRALS